MLVLYAAYNKWKKKKKEIKLKQQKAKKDQLPYKFITFMICIS